MKIEAGKYYWTRNGQKAFICGRNPFGEDDGYHWIGIIEEDSCSPTGWYKDGSLLSGEYSDEDLVGEWCKPRKLTACVNFDRDGNIYVFATREEADEEASHDRIACVEVTALQGDGLKK